MQQSSLLNITMQQSSSYHSQNSPSFWWGSWVWKHMYDADITVVPGVAQCWSIRPRRMCILQYLLTLENKATMFVQTKPPRSYKQSHHVRTNKATTFVQTKPPRSFKQSHHVRTNKATTFVQTKPLRSFKQSHYVCSNKATMFVQTKPLCSFKPLSQGQCHITEDLNPSARLL
jgi:hypothetical protein